MTPLERLVDHVCDRATAVPGDVVAVVGREVDLAAPLANAAERAEVVRRAVARLDGLGALDHLLADPDVDEVMVNGGTEVWVDRRGELTRLDDLAPGSIELMLERVLAPLGKRLDRTSPIVDARLPDGSRLCAVIEPVALDGPTLTIRRHRPQHVPLDRFAPGPTGALLNELIAARANVLVTGATSTGKTTLLAALAACVDTTERLVLIEDTAELLLEGHVLRLEARPPGIDGVKAVDTASLVRTALRLRPDRLILGEFRGLEALAVVEALNTGHDGSLSTCHANSAIDGLRRLETLVMQAAPSWPLAAIRRQVTRSIDAVVHLVRASDGARIVHEVVEVVEGDGEPAGRLLASRHERHAPFTRGRR